MQPPRPNVDPVTLPAVYKRLQVTQQTAREWSANGEMPEPLWAFGNAPGWDWRSQVGPWAIATGRARDLGDDPDAGACPACGGTLGRQVALQRPGGAAGRREPVQRGEPWHSCRSCGWTSFEPADWEPPSILSGPRDGDE
jgi:hypothetical protein